MQAPTMAMLFSEKSFGKCSSDILLPSSIISRLGYKRAALQHTLDYDLSKHTAQVLSDRLPSHLGFKTTGYALLRKQKMYDYNK